MKSLFLIVALLSFTLTASFAQNKKAEKEAAAKAQFDKAVAAIDAKDFVIIVDSYEAGNGTFETNTDNANFISYEKEFVFMQGWLVGNNSTYKMDVSDYKQTVDKKGSLKVEMQLRGSLISAKVEIFMKSGGNYADVIVSPSKGGTKRFSGEVIPKSESKFNKRPGVV